MKKFLSLVLALVMAMSLVTISAGAADFKDEASIDPIYAEAVDVISALGIVSGNDGAFMPQDNLTRGAAAKILAGIKLGSELAAKLPKTSSFSDVAAGSTFAGYISYLKDQGIVGGYGDGTFGPSNKLTGDAFLKQVLGVLGYKSDIEGYGVAGWQVTVAIDALNAGLLKGMEENFNSAALITREQAAQIILNALQANMVYYPTQSSIQIGDVVINNSSEAQLVKVVVNDVEDIVQLSEKTFPTLTKIDDVTDDMNRPATQWNYKGQKLVLCVDPMVVKYINAPVYKDLYAALGLTDEKVNWIAYEDGDVYNNKNYTDGKGYNGQLTATSGSSMVNANRATTYEIYYDSTKTTPVTAIITNQYIGKVDKVTGTGSARTLTIVPMDNATYSFPVSAKLTTAKSISYQTADFAEDDVVVFTYSYKTKTIQTIAAAEYITGKVTKSIALEDRATIFVDDVEVKYAWGNPWSLSNSVDAKCTYGTADLFNKSGLKVGDTVKVWLDSNSRYLYVEAAGEETPAAEYAYVLKAGQNKGADATWLEDSTAGTYGAQLLFVDGTVEVVETSASATDLVNDFVTYTINKKGQYVLTDATEGNVAEAKAVLLEKGKAWGAVNGIGFDKDGKINGSLALNAASIVLVQDKDEDGKVIYTSYLGYENLPVELKGDALSDVVMKKDSKIAAYIFVDATADGFSYKKTSSTQEYLLINGHTGWNKPTEYDDGEFKWYEFNAIVDGEVELIKIAATKENKANLKRLAMVFTEYTIDENGFYNLPSAPVGVTKYIDEANTNVGYEYADGILIAGDRAPVYYALDEDIIIAYCDGNAAYLWTEADLVKDTNDELFIFDLDKDGDIDALFVNKK